jgi:hypothetical protein
MPPRVSVWKWLLFEFVSHTLHHNGHFHKRNDAIAACPVPALVPFCNLTCLVQAEPTTTTTLSVPPPAALESSLFSGVATLLVQLGLGLFQVGLGACSRRRGQVVHATAVSVEPSASVPSDKHLRALLSQVEFVSSPPAPLEPPPKSAPSLPEVRATWGGAGPKRPSDLRRARPFD